MLLSGTVSVSLHQMGWQLARNEQNMKPVQDCTGFKFCTFSRFYTFNCKGAHIKLNHREASSAEFESRV